MQDFVCAISCVLFPVLLGPVSAIHVNYPFPACFVTVDNWRLLPALATVVSAALEPGNWTLEEEFMVTPSSTSSGTLRINHPRQPGALCGLGSCATTRLNPLLFTMQDFVCAISCVLFPVLLGPVSAIHVNYPFPACFVTVDNWRLLPALATVVSAALEPGNWTLEEEFMVTPSSTSSGTLRINHPRQPGALCGLGSCATTRLNPLLFTMQDFVCAISCVLFPVLLGPVSAIHVNYPFPACFVTVDNWRLLPALATVVSAALEPGNWTLEEEFMVTPSSTSSGTLRINHPRQPGALCGLGSCATTRLNPLLFTMQVSNQCRLFAKKSSNRCLILLPSPQCCVCIMSDCINSVCSLLLMLSGDIETNPGPPTLNEILNELKGLSSGQSQLIGDVQSLKSQLSSTDKTICELGKRIDSLESHYHQLQTLRTELDTVATTTSQTTRQVSILETRLDDMENRSRRNNLLFYGIADETPSETNAQSEELITAFCRDHFNVAIESKEIERAHRLGRHLQDRCRPIIVKFTSFKTKETVLANGSKLKNTHFSIGEDFSPLVRNARKHLLAFAKEKSGPFLLRYKTLFMGSKRYVFDNATETIEEKS
ncbi:uncharacterized protein LOC142578662 [Dermacentor variabilis]|uniref:uncharacterized protein LOC142578662 n=1 Tax=Dermacentor variabilis TaxID=34621 RepID=UPI003F5B28E3